MAAARQGLPVRLDRALQRRAAFAITRASRRARTRSIGSRSRARGSSLIFDNPPPPLLRRWRAATWTSLDPVSAPDQVDTPLDRTIALLKQGKRGERKIDRGFSRFR